MEDEMLEGAIQILTTLNEHGFDAYMVGGFVRDHLLGIKSKDIDITTNALPDVVQSIFPDNFSKSLKFKTVNVRQNGFEYEVTTYRVEHGYHDHRHPKTKVSSSLKMDVKRRDFTINALCMDKNQKIIDYVNGKTDLRNGIIRTVGAPRRRFNEDALRMFRCFRFASRLGFAIDDKTYRGIKKNVGLVKYISKERVRSELEGTLDAHHFDQVLSIMIESGLYYSYPDLEMAFRILHENYSQINIIDLVILASYLKGDITEEVILSKKERKYVFDTLNFIKLLQNQALTPIDLFDTDLDPVLTAIKVLSIIREHPYSKEAVEELYSSLKIHAPKDLMISGDDVKKALGLVDSPSIKDYLLKAISGVIYGYVANEKQALLDYLKGLNS